MSAYSQNLAIKALDLGHPVERLLSVQLSPGELLLDGGGEGEDGRYSALCLYPNDQLVLSAHHDKGMREQLLELERFVVGTREGREVSAEVSSASSPLPCPAPLISCLLSYELGAPDLSAEGATERNEALHERLLRLPTVWATRYTSCYVWDQREGRGWLIATHEEALERASLRLTATHRSPLSTDALLTDALTTGPLEPTWSVDEHAQAILDAQRLMRNGEVYQVNLTCALTATLRDAVSAEAVYLRLRHSNPAPFGAFLRLDDERFVLCQSPERFVKWSATGSVRTEPIKGTRPRGQDEAEDLTLQRALVESLKDRAEHTMIVDLERNDLGRVCVPGTVQVEALRALRSFPTVHHLVSVIRGRLRTEVGLAELLMALFPGGSITGAPKRRAMEAISRLEPHARGLYCGALGYMSADGAGDLNLPIRTCWLEGRALTYHAGGGVVADSTPEGEWAELWVKARAISRGLEGTTAHQRPLDP